MKRSIKNFVAGAGAVRTEISGHHGTGIKRQERMKSESANKTERSETQTPSASMKKNIKHVSAGTLTEGAEMPDYQETDTEERRRLQLERLNESELPELRLPSSLSREHTRKSWKQFSKKHVGKDLFVKEN